jgi:hypothetical protein
MHIVHIMQFFYILFGYIAYFVFTIFVSVTFDWNFYANFCIVAVCKLMHIFLHLFLHISLHNPYIFPVS